MQIEQGNFYLNGHFFDYALVDDTGKILMVAMSLDILKTVLVVANKEETE